ncbi:D-2-hydroxyacid dehydrogenase (plasmid) [Azospirillum sp. TSA2s]|uniref:D-2-hydroxyacid dehydrogenase n=1 Tax=Azospirillum sp. TSA2s TaxID=709810 RepID=UPI0010AA688B|nr:D-2-hydroxyacid dehydrogenase [Azospirillum sp. TSA2s]
MSLAAETLPVPAPVIVVLDAATLAPGIALRRPAVPHAWRDFDRTAAGDTAERLRDATVAVVNKVRLDRATLDAAPGLRLVLVAATGMDNIDLDACAERGIAVRNVVGYGAATVAEHVFALVLALRRNLIAYRQSVLDGRWEESGQFCYHDFPVRELQGSRLALIGSGAIGGAVGRIAEAFGMEVVVAARKGRAAEPGRVSFEEALATADVLSLHCPLTPETRGLFDAQAFARMERRPILINTARGALIDGPALVDAVTAGRVSGVGLDVLAVEPITPDDPVRAILRHPNVIVTPHVAWAGRAAQQRIAETLSSALDEFLQCHRK